LKNQLFTILTCYLLFLSVHSGIRILCENYKKLNKAELQNQPIDDGIDDTISFFIYKDVEPGITNILVHSLATHLSNDQRKLPLTLAYLSTLFTADIFRPPRVS
jgi:hypothetical protein